MAAKITSKYEAPDKALIGAAPWGNVYVGADTISKGYHSVVVDRAEFLSTVATELDVIVIERADLPTVEVTGHGPGGHDVRVNGRIQGISQTDTPAYFRAVACRYLALAEHLENHPPVDAAQVDALRHLMADAGNYGSVDGVPWAFARDLVAAGVRAPENNKES